MLESQLNTLHQKALDHCLDAMRVDASPQLACTIFAAYFRELCSGKKGYISDTEITPLTSDQVVRYGDIASYEEHGRRVISKTVVVKLNGGLGTSMGLNAPKSLLEAKNGLTFLDIIALQIQTLNNNMNTEVPLVLLNSFATHEQSCKTIESYRHLKNVVPRNLLQNRFPRILKDTFEPVFWPADPRLQWNPPGHGDLITTLITSGMIDQFLHKGFRYLFISNCDNLGATLDYRILGYMAANSIPFIMEAALRTEMDRKGGHIALLRNSKRLLLRELAQCPPLEISSFQDTGLHRYFNTNNIWIDLAALKQKLDASDNNLCLPMIRNEKLVDPHVDGSPRIYQIESAIGSAISHFDNAAVVEISRERFIPIKKSGDLLLLWSDFYSLADDYTIQRDPQRGNDSVSVILDDHYFAFIDQLKSRFPKGAPSLRECKSFTVEGDVRFIRPPIIKGNSIIRNTTGRQLAITQPRTIDGLFNLTAE